MVLANVICLYVLTVSCTMFDEKEEEKKMLYNLPQYAMAFKCLHYTYIGFVLQRFNV